MRLTALQYSAHQETIEKNAAAESVSTTAPRKYVPVERCDVSARSHVRRRRAPTNPSVVSSDEEMMSKRQRHLVPAVVAQPLAPPPLTVHQSPLTVSARMPAAQSCIDLGTFVKVLVAALILAVAAMYFALPKRGL